jgi:hypothetical protein
MFLRCFLLFLWFWCNAGIGVDTRFASLKTSVQEMQHPIFEFGRESSLIAEDIANEVGQGVDILELQALFMQYIDGCE